MTMPCCPQDALQSCKACALTCVPQWPSLGEHFAKADDRGRRPAAPDQRQVRRHRFMWHPSKVEGEVT